MKAVQSSEMQPEEKKFWMKVKGLVFSDTSAVVVMGVAVVIGLVVNFF